MTRHVTEEVLATYTLQLVGPTITSSPAFAERVLNAYVRETEENLTDLLPEGYSVRIREWDSDEWLAWKRSSQKRRDESQKGGYGQRAWTRHIDFAAIEEEETPNE